MNNLKVFSSEEFGEIRTVSVNDEPYVMLNDVCEILDIKNVSDVKARLKKDGVVNNEVMDRLGRMQVATFINESNLYKVIFQSRKPQAEQFTDWVTSEVLPSIRKNGGYIANQENLTPEQIVANALIVAQNIIQEKDRLLSAQAPKVLFADAVATSHTSILVGELAKLINQNGVNIGPYRLFEWLRDNGFLIKRNGTDYNMPTQYSMDLVLFEIKERSIANPDGSVRITKTPKVTGKGQQYFINKFLR